jgi:hypothetical protein
VLRGWERAGAWAVPFGTSLGAESYPKPSAIYAANPEAISLDETSQRPFQTVIPLSERLGITPIITYSVGQEVQLVSEVLHSSGVVLISWRTKRSRRKSYQGLPVSRRSKISLTNGTKPDMMLFCASIGYLQKHPGRFINSALV